MDYFCDFCAWWNGRREDADGLAQRLTEYITSLVAIDPLFTKLMRGGMRRRIAAPKRIALLPSVSEQRLWLGDPIAPDGDETIRIVYAIHANTPLARKPYATLTLFVMEGARPGDLHGYVGHAMLMPEGEASRVEIAARPMLMAMAEAWDPVWAGVGCYQQPCDPRLGNRHFRSGWMIYLDHEHAGRIALPEDVSVETLAAGGLVMTATNACFDRGDPAQVAAARRIHAALAPLNAEIAGAMSQSSVSR